MKSKRLNNLCRSEAENCHCFAEINGFWQFLHQLEDQHVNFLMHFKGGMSFAIIYFREIHFLTYVIKSALDPEDWNTNLIYFHCTLLCVCDFEFTQYTSAEGQFPLQLLKCQHCVLIYQHCTFSIWIGDVGENTQMPLAVILKEPFQTLSSSGHVHATHRVIQGVYRNMV